jgi:hypothetical protein
MRWLATCLGRGCVGLSARESADCGHPGPAAGGQPVSPQVGWGRPGDADHRSARVGQTGVRHVSVDTPRRKPGATFPVQATPGNSAARRGGLGLRADSTETTRQPGLAADCHHCLARGGTIHHLRPGAHRATWVRDNLPVAVGQRPDATDPVLSLGVELSQYGIGANEARNGQLAEISAQARRIWLVLSHDEYVRSTRTGQALV